MYTDFVMQNFARAWIEEGSCKTGKQYIYSIPEGKSFTHARIECGY